MYSQNGSVKGRVINYHAEPVIGANVIVKGTTYGAAADEKGNFEINEIPYGNYSLEISSVGYEKKAVDITVSMSTKPLKIFLREAAIETEQIIVSAGKYEQKQEDLTVSTDVIQPDYITRQNFQTFDEMLRTIPGVQMNLEQVSIRGSSGYSKGVGARVLVALNGIPLYAGDNGDVVWEIIPISDVERVEVIKGPSSSLYGSSAIGGVINIITKSAVKNPVTYVRSYIGFYDNPSYNVWKWNKASRTFYGVGVTHSSSVGKLGYTLSFKRFDDMSYRENDYSKRYLGYVKLDYQFTTENHLTFFADYLNMDRGNFLYWKDSRDALIPDSADNGNTVKSDRIFTGLIYHHQFSDKLNADFKTSYYRTNFDGYGLEVTSSTADLVRGEALTNYKFSDSFRLTSGAEVSYSTVQSNIFSNTDFIGSGIYAQVEYKGIKDLIATAGIRGDYIKIDTIDGKFAVTPRAGLNYKLNENFIMRASIGTGFRAPTPAEIFTTTSLTGGLSIKGNPDLTAETNVSAEVGFNYSDKKFLDWDAALFYTKYKNYIEPNIVSDGIKFINVPNADVYGIENDITLQLIDGLLTSKLGYMYLWARDPDKHKALKYRPRHSVTTNFLLRLDPVELGLNFRFQSKFEEIDDLTTTLVVDGDKHVPIYVTDAMIGYNFFIGNVPAKVHLNAKNILNYNYVEFIGNLAPIRNFSLSAEIYF